MMAKNKSVGSQLGGVLVFLGSLVYLYEVFTWLSGGAVLSGWASAASFLGPFVAALAVISSITLFFLSLGLMAGKVSSDAKEHGKLLWKFIMLGALTVLIVASASWSTVVVGFVLTYLGAWATMM